MTAPTASRGGGAFAPLLTVEEALARLLAHVPAPLATETVAPLAALGRVVAADVVAAVSLPPWDNSAMDGYAIRSRDTERASERQPVSLRVVGEIAAGSPPDVVVEPETAVRIATGAPLPEGADAVVPVEATTPLDAMGTPGPRGREAAGPLPAACLVHEAVVSGGAVRPAGSDLRAGTTILGAGSVVLPPAVTLLAGAAVPEVAVHRRPRVAVLATGDEVRLAGQPLGPAGIPDANRPGLLAHVIAAGGEPIDLGVAVDRLDDVLDRLKAAIEGGADAVVVSGGVSVGPYDVVRTAFETLATIELWRVAVQPGKPFAFAAVPRGAGEPPVLLFGLPGNPVSTVVTFELFVRPALRRLAGHRLLTRPKDRAVLADPATKSRGRRAFLRVSVDRDPSGSPLRDDGGRLSVRLAGGQGSHVISTLAATDALAVVPEELDTLPSGSELEMWWLDPRV